MTVEQLIMVGFIALTLLIWAGVVRALYIYEKRKK